jgi:hypothetical protein
MVIRGMVFRGMVFRGNVIRGNVVRGSNIDPRSYKGRVVYRSKKYMLAIFETA